MLGSGANSIASDVSPKGVENHDRTPTWKGAVERAVTVPRLAAILDNDSQARQPSIIAGRRDAKHIGT